MEILADAMPDKAAIPRSTDGMVDIQSLLRLLAEGGQRHHGRGGRPALRRWGQQQERLQGPRPRDVRGHAQPENPQAQDGQLLPRGRPRALPARRPRARRGGSRDVRHRHQHQEGAEDSREDGHREARQGPRERDRRSMRARYPTSGSTRPTSSAAAGAAWLRPQWSRR